MENVVRETRPKHQVEVIWRIIAYGLGTKLQSLQHPEH